MLKIVSFPVLIQKECPLVSKHQCHIAELFKKSNLSHDTLNAGQSEVVVQRRQSGEPLRGDQRDPAEQRRLRRQVLRDVPRVLLRQEQSRHLEEDLVGQPRLRQVFGRLRDLQGCMFIFGYFLISARLEVDYPLWCCTPSRRRSRSA